MQRSLWRMALALILSVALLPAVGAARPARRSRAIERFPPLTLVNVNAPGQPRLTLRLYDRRGRFVAGALRRVARFLRCHRTGRRHPIAARLLVEAYRVARRFGGRPLLVYSAFRHRRVARLKGSFHTRGRAMDFRIEGVSNRQIRDFLLASRRPIGVGYYTGSPFVHLDVRDRPAFWVDFSGPGEPSRYAPDPRALLRAERQGASPAELEALARTGTAPIPATAPTDEALEDRAEPDGTVLINAAGGAPPDPLARVSTRGQGSTAPAPAPQPLGPVPTAAGASPTAASRDEDSGANAAPVPTPVLE